ncbi:hypothetical protein QBC33DRAFT_520210 [Phialemonium atrogriseum]|uniref:Uncharacterized protein n=1 Tax=Phialemonium atrogriseum TaxID=1093897 RepID=A0AAJ0FH27_9PEZI|nr:uncharacterized protein QBC33DRAFT_520210 [Phialemonium atrogriseum]KAK1761699.1 hypothetical protein QBC33DRAFT_520210 [Phialemonium atrogriseum]
MFQTTLLMLMHSASGFTQRRARRSLRSRVSARTALRGLARMFPSLVTSMSRVMDRLDGLQSVPSKRRSSRLADEGTQLCAKALRYSSRQRNKLLERKDRKCKPLALALASAFVLAVGLAALTAEIKLPFMNVHLFGATLATKMLGGATDVLAGLLDVMYYGWPLSLYLFVTMLQYGFEVQSLPLRRLELKADALAYKL